MDYINKSWELEDQLYAPKRKVNNRISFILHHIIGSFYSQKMNNIIEYESLSELIFYYFLELDTLTIRYYVQPLDVPIIIQNKNGEIKQWSHVPDVLVFRQDSVPQLIQIKDPRIEETKLHQITNKCCENFAILKNWNYCTIYPKNLPNVLHLNSKFLFGFIEEREGYKNWIPQIMMKLKFFKKKIIADLARSFEPEISQYHILPIIYHLIAKGKIYTNLYTEIDVNSEVLHKSFNILDEILSNERFSIGNKTSGTEITGKNQISKKV